MKAKLICKDHTVSGETFELIYNADLDLLETYPKPSLANLPNYYKSDNYISHTDAKKTFFDKIYQAVKNHTVSSKIRLINSFNSETHQLLDVGCGTGDFLKAAEKKGWTISGVEPDGSARKLTKHKINSKKSIYVNLKEIVNRDKKDKFDVISLWHVLEHVSDLDSYIAQLKSLLKLNGYLIIAVPNFKSYDAKHYKEFWAAYDVPRHLWHFSQKSILKIFLKHKMFVIDILPMRFDSFYVSLLSEKYKTGKLNIFSAFISGFLSNWKARKTKEYSSLIYLIKNKAN